MEKGKDKDSWGGKRKWTDESKAGKRGGKLGWGVGGLGITENEHAHKACCHESINIDQPSVGTSSCNQR